MAPPDAVPRLCDALRMRRLNGPFAMGVLSSLVASFLLSAGSWVGKIRLDWRLVAGIVALAAIVGLSAALAVLWSRERLLRSDLERLDYASWPAWMRDVGQAALASRVRVYREAGSIVFEHPDGTRHLLNADPPGEGLGRVLERDRILKTLEAWGVPMVRTRRGHLYPANAGDRDGSPA